MSRKPKTTTTKEATKPALVPRLRFPEFLEAEGWRNEPLRNVCNVLQGYGFPERLQGNSASKYPFCKVSDISRAVAERGGLLIEAANYVSDEVLLELRATPIPEGATVFAKIGEALRLNRRAYVQRQCLIDNNAVGLKAIDDVADDYFVFLLSQLIDLNEHCGGAVPSVNKSTLEAIHVVVPSRAEQQRIAECLRSVDEAIAAQARKLVALKTYKKGLMQQLFPRQGETQPRLRFPEFQNAGEWKLKKAGTLFSNRVAKGEQGLPIYSVTMYDGMVRRDSLDRNYYDIEDAASNKKVCRGDIAYNMMRMWQGAVGIAPEDCLVSPAYIVLAPAEGTVPEFFQYLFKLPATLLTLTSHSRGLTKDRLRLYYNDFARIPLRCPSPDEQRRIADCLTSLDDLIAAQTRELSALKTHKQGLIQQLFPAPDANEA